MIVYSTKSMKIFMIFPVFPLLAGKTWRDWFESYHPSQTVPVFHCYRNVSAFSATFPRLAYIGLYVRRHLETNRGQKIAIVSLRFFQGTSFGSALLL